MTKDSLPHLHELAPGLWAGLGFNGRGVGIGTLFGRLLAELALGARPADLPFPVTSMRPIPGYPFTRIVARALVRVLSGPRQPRSGLTRVALFRQLHRSSS